MNNNNGSFQLEVGPGQSGTNRVAISSPSTWVAQTENNALLEGEWNYIVYTRSGDGAEIHAIYVNGEQQALVSDDPYTFTNNSSNKLIGSENGSEKFFSGKIDEVRLWNIALDSVHIRENMHLAIPGNESGLVSYWQFNEGSGTTAIDVISQNNGILANMNENDWLDSTIPFGGGEADSQTEANANVVFTDTGLEMYFSAQSGAEITVSRIDTVPNLNPVNPVVVFDSEYWVVNRFGSGTFDTDLTFTLSEDLTVEDESDPASISLYTRGSTADTAWTMLTSASTVDAANNTATFNGITGFSQFIIAKETAHDIDLDLMVFLEGPFNGTNMETDLNPDDIPLTQPFNVAPWNYSGTESVTSIPNADVVDWVLIELRDTTDAALATGETMIARQAAFLLNDGEIVGLDGDRDKACLVSTPPISNNLFVVIYHRNHLPIMSANPLTESGGVYTYDFTTPINQAYGTDAQKDLGSGVYGMFSADANADGDVNVVDKTIWENQAGESGYKSGDFDMDGQVNNPDKNEMWVPNDGEVGQVPE